MRSVDLRLRCDSVMVVAMEPAVKCPGPGGLAAVGPDVGPLLEKGPVESLYLSIGLGPIRAAVAVLDPGFASAWLKSSLVGERVVGHHPLDHDAVGPEEGLGSPPEGRGGGPGLVGEHLGVGQAGVVVDGGVDVGEADPSLAVVPLADAARPRTLCPPPSGIFPSFFTSTWTRSPGRFARSGGLAPGWRSRWLETVEVVAHEDPVDGRGRQPQAAAEAVRPELVGPPPAADLVLDLGRCLGWRASGPGRAIEEPVGPELEVTVPPLGGTPPGDSHGRGHVSDRAPCLDALAEQESTLGGEWGVSVGHEDLRGGCAGFDTCTSTSGGLRFGGPSSSGATNVRGGNI